MWNKPWKLKEGICISSGLVLTGLLLQFVIGPVAWSAFAFPVNIIVLGVIVGLLILAYALKEKVYFFKFSLSYAAAVPAILFTVVLTIVMGLTKQSNEAPNVDPLGLTNALTCWPFVLTYCWLAWIVGITTIHHLMHFSMRRMPALLSHCGLFLVLVCGTLGSADMQRLKMYCEYNKPEWRALDNANKVHELPIAIQLDSFIIEEYPPKLTLVDNKTMKAVEVGGKPLSVLIDDKFTGADMGGWHVTVDKVLDLAAPKMTADTTTYVEWPVKGACCAVLAKATKTSGDSSNNGGRTVPAEMAGGHSVAGWVTCGSYALPQQMLTLDNNYSIGMSQREPKRYASKIQILSKEGDNIETIVEVNKPYSLMGWKIYQYSYNEMQGRWSNYSVFELVADPWLPIVYIGIGLLLLGALGLFFGRRTN